MTSFVYFDWNGQVIGRANRSQRWTYTQPMVYRTVYQLRRQKALPKPHHDLNCILFSTTRSEGIPTFVPFITPVCFLSTADPQSMSFPISHHYDDTFEPDVSLSISPVISASQSQHSLFPMPNHDSPQSWTAFDQALLPSFQPQQQLMYRGFHTPAPYPVPRLSSSSSTAGGGQVSHNVSRLSLAGSLDPTTGIFYRTPEHPRLRTAQACEKCRTRKAKVLSTLLW